MVNYTCVHPGAYAEGGSVMAGKLLVVDDEPNIVKGLKFSLEQDGFIVDTALDGMEGFQKASNGQYDLIILDVMLPGIDGMEVLSRLRQQSRVPVLMLTAKGEDMDKILGLEYGADDYMTKPFNILELKARVKAVLRRIQEPQAQKEDPDIIHSGQMTIHLGHRTVTIGERSINLTAKEFDLLALFASHPGNVFNREALLETVWKYDYLGDLRTVDVHIRRLREKIETNPSDPEYIFTKWELATILRINKEILYSIRLKIALSYLALIAVGFFSLLYFITRYYEDVELSNKEDSFRRYAVEVAQGISNDYNSADPDIRANVGYRIQKLSEDIRTEQGGQSTRILVLDYSGIVRYESNNDLSTEQAILQRNLWDYPVVRNVLTGLDRGPDPTVLYIDDADNIGEKQRCSTLTPPSPMPRAPSREW